ncbi:MAG TPA: LapB repeat-containing protein [Acholeplasma sp.]|nr:LapB repeat-containing protein [Acholeplasma sp.]
MFKLFVVTVNLAVAWFNTTIEIPLGDSVEQHKTEPYAILYIDDKEVTDPAMYYDYEAWTSSLRVINTNIIGEYHVLYRVYYPKYGLSSEETITFRVVDKINPVIHADKDLYFDVGTKLPDFKLFVSYEDNYDDFEGLTLSIDSSRVNMAALGTYPLTFKVKDRSGNQTLFTSNVHIVDETKPIITQKKEVILSINETLELDKYFTVTDNYDKVIKIKLENEIDTSVVGNYTARITATDQSGNTSSYLFEVTVIDDEPPMIRLITNKITINYKDVLTLNDLKNYIEYVSDNVDELFMDDVKIESGIRSNFLGTYEVRYQVRDSSGLLGQAILQVIVADLEAPTMDVISDLEFEVNTLEPYIYDYLKIEDNYDLYNKLNITISGKVSMDKIGEYRLIITIKDTSKNEATYPVVVKVVDQTKPEIELLKEIVIRNFIKPNYRDYLKITDNYDKEIELKINDQNVDYEKIGTYMVEVSAKDKSGNEMIQKVEVKVIDDQSPEIILSNNISYINYFDQINLKSFIDEIHDNYDKNLSKDDVSITTDLDTSKLGLYEVIYQITDSSHNIGENSIYIYVVDYNLPELTIKPITLRESEQFNIHDFVSAYDDYDGDISNMVRMSPSYIPTNLPNLYEVTFYVHDSSGNLAQEKVTIEVQEKDLLKDYLIYGIGLSFVIIGGVLFYYFNNKRAKF